MTSTLLIVLFSREGSHWELDNLLFIRNYGLTQFNGYEKMKKSPTSYSVFGIFSFIPPHWVRTYLCLTSFIERILPNSHFVRLGITLVLFWRCLSSHRVMTRVTPQLGLKNICPAGPDEKVSNPFQPPRVVQTQRIQADSQSHLVRRLADDFKVPLLGSTCVITVSLNTSFHST